MRGIGVRERVYLLYYTKGYDRKWYHKRSKITGYLREQVIPYIPFQVGTSPSINIQVYNKLEFNPAVTEGTPAQRLFALGNH